MTLPAAFNALITPIAAPTLPAASGVTAAATRTILAATDPTLYAAALLTEGERAGWFTPSTDNHAADIAADLNQGLYVAFAADPSGASGAWVRSYNALYAEFFGVHGDVINDDLVNMQHVLTTMVHVNVAVLHCENIAGFAFSDTLVIGDGTTSSNSTYNNITFVGKGGTTVFSGTTGSVIKRVIKAGGDVVKVQGPIIGIALLGAWTVDGNGLAAGGMDVVDGCDCQFPSLKIVRCIGTYLRLYTAGPGYGGCRNCRIETYTTDTVPSGATGLLLDGATTLATIDTLQNTFGTIDMPISPAGAIGIQLGYCDFNDLGIVDISPQGPLTTSVAIKLMGTGPVGNANFPCMNHFGMVAAGGGIVTDTTHGKPFGNVIDLYDLPDSNATVPTAIGIMGYAHTTYGTIGASEVVSFGFKPPNWNTVTPPRPTGLGVAHAVVNTNPYPVQVYSAGGAGLGILDSHGTNAGVLPAGTQGGYVIPRGGSVYFNTTLPTSWLWSGSL